MDIDTESIIKLISPNGIPDTWKDNPDFYSYLAKLGNYGVEQLSKEPDHLNAEKAAILNQTQDLAFANYKTFIRTAECSREIFQEFGRAESRLERLLTEVPELSRRCSEMRKAAEEIRRRRRANTTALTRHSAVLQVLEAPQLMESLVREEMYEEALQLSAYVRHLGKSHPNIPIIQSVAEEVERWRGGLLGRLVGGLGSCTLPKALQLVGHLRRMGCLTEQELRLKFLQAREAWIQAGLTQIPKTDDRLQHLTRVLDYSRTQLFNVVTQYRALFAEDESAASPRPKFNETLPLHSWINEKMVELRCRIEEDLKGELGVSDIGVALGSASRLGQSLGRVGADGRGAVLSAPFVASIRTSLASALTQTVGDVSRAIERFDPARPLPQPLLQEQEVNLGGAGGGPPLSLLRFYPLSLLHNGVVGALNQLRLCAPLCLARATTHLLESTLISASNDILSFYRREQGALSGEEMETLVSMCVCLSDQLIPYFQKCLHSVYPPTEIASFLSLPPHSIQAQGLTFLNKKKILAPIEHLLPPKLEPKINFGTSVPLVESTTVTKNSTEGEGVPLVSKEEGHINEEALND